MGDFSLVDWADPEIEFMITGGAEAGRWVGLAAMTRASRDWLSSWEDVHVLVDEYRELDDTRVLALTRSSGRGKASGLEFGRMRTRGATLFNVRDGSVTRLVIYADRERALADLRLTPEGSEIAPHWPVLEGWAPGGRLVSREVVDFGLDWPLPPADLEQRPTPAATRREATNARRSA